MFERAVRTTGGTRDFDYCLAGRVIRLSFAGDALVDTFTPAFTHLVLPSQRNVDITVRLWDVASTGAILPPPPWQNDAYGRRGEIIGYSDGVHFTTFHADSRILFMYDALRHFGLVAVFDRSDLPAYERAAPLRPILSDALVTYDVQYTHAAAVGLPEGGVLLAGKGGAGKSTASLACLDSELLFAGDDYCAVCAPAGGLANADETPMVYSMYNSAKGDRATVSRLPFLEPLIRYWDVGGSEKAIWFLQEHFAHKLAAQFPLRAILIPRVTFGRDTRVTPAPAHAALLALAPSTVAQLPNANVGLFQRLAALARRLPSLYLDVGTEMAQIPQTILRVLAEYGVR